VRDGAKEGATAGEVSARLGTRVMLHGGKNFPFPPSFLHPSTHPATHCFLRIACPIVSTFDSPFPRDVCTPHRALYKFRLVLGGRMGVGGKDVAGLGEAGRAEGAGEARWRQHKSRQVNRAREREC